jgi:hypothetical protein
MATGVDARERRHHGDAGVAGMMMVRVMAGAAARLIRVSAAAPARIVPKVFDIRIFPVLLFDRRTLSSQGRLRNHKLLFRHGHKPPS